MHIRKRAPTPASAHRLAYVPWLPPGAASTRFEAM